MSVVEAKFKLGQVVWTRGVNELIAESIDFAKFVTDSLKRHTTGDWGALCNEDQQENERALLEGNRLFSGYETKGQPRIWIITERDRSVTTILFPSEY